jgi:hypothetical protein
LACRSTELEVWKVEIDKVVTKYAWPFKGKQKHFIINGL